MDFSEEQGVRLTDTRSCEICGAATSAEPGRVRLCTGCERTHQAGLVALVEADESKYERDSNGRLIGGANCRTGFVLYVGERDIERIFNSSARCNGALLPLFLVDRGVIAKIMEEWPRRPG